MGNLLILRQRAHDALLKDISLNLTRYREGNFLHLITDPSHYICVSENIDVQKLEGISCTPEDTEEVACCIAMHEAMGIVPPYMARDSRLWVLITHTLMLKYTRIRWPIPEDDPAAIEHIKKHFFAIGTRGIERDNAASRLWWMASLCSRVKNLTLEQALETFLYKSDVRANIIERPTTSQTIPVFSALLNELHVSYSSDRVLFEREKFRPLMKALNIQGGTKLLEVLNESEVSAVLSKCIPN